MANKSKKCYICEFEIAKRCKSTLHCPKCTETVHIDCAKINDLIAQDGKYYCKNHLPTEFIRASTRNETTENSIRDNNLQPIVPPFSINDSSLVMDPAIHSSLINHPPNAQIPPDNPIKNVQDPIGTQATTNTNANAGLFHQIRLPNQNFNVPITSRTPNAPDIRNPPPPFNKICTNCFLQIDGQFFCCYKCRASFHEACVSRKERQNNLEGYWGCTSCLISWAQYISLKNYAGNDQAIIDERDGLQAHMYANLRLDDPYLNPPRQSIFPMPARILQSHPIAPLHDPIPSTSQNNPLPNALNIPHEFQQNVINPQNNPLPNASNIQHEPPKDVTNPQIERNYVNSVNENLQRQNNAGNPGTTSFDADSLVGMFQNLQEQQNNQMERMFTQLMNVMMTNMRMMNNCNPIPQANENQNPTNSNNPINQSNPAYNNTGNNNFPQVRNTSLDQLEEILQEESRNHSRAFAQPQINNNSRNMDVTNSISLKLAEIQIAETKKNAYKILPKVNYANYEWKVFYRAFLETKDLFSAQENVSRLQEAILCEEIKQIGSFNLFSLETYEETLEEIDKRIGKPAKMLLKEKQKLFVQRKLHNGQKKEIIKFIGDIKRYSTLVDKIGDDQNKHDYPLLKQLMRTLPERLLNGWMTEFTRMENAGEIIMISHIASWLDKKIEECENLLMLEEDDPSVPQKDRNFKSQQNKKGPKGRNEKEISFAQTNSYAPQEKKEFNKKPRHDKESNESLASFCWYHNSSGHSSLCCYALLAKTGKEVSDLAKEKGICTLCGNKSHRVCPYKNQITCIVPNCNYNHRSIFCYQRKVQKAFTRYRRQDNHEHKPNFHNRNKENDNAPKNTEQPSTSQPKTDSNVMDALHIHTEITKDNAEEQWNVMVEEIPTTVGNKDSSMTQISYSSRNLTTIIPINLKNGDKTLKCAILLDTGSTASVIDEDYANFLNADGPKVELGVKWSGNKSREDKESRIIRIKAQGLHENAKTFDIFFRTMKDLKMPAQSLNADEMIIKFPHLREVPLTSYNHVIGIIGTDQKWFHKQLKWIEAKNNTSTSPSAILTPLGYTLLGSAWPLPKLYYHSSDKKEKKDQ